MYRILITLEIILITDTRQVTSNSGMFKIQISMRSLYPSPHKLLSCEEMCKHSFLLSLSVFFFVTFRDVTENTKYSWTFFSPMCFLSFQQGYLFWNTVSLLTKNMGWVIYQLSLLPFKLLLFKIEETFLQVSWEWCQRYYQPKHNELWPASGSMDVLLFCLWMFSWLQFER